MSEQIENNPLEFSNNDPITEAAGLEAVLGMINPKELGQVENDSVAETELEEDFVEESVDDEVEETLDQTEDDELEESDEPEMSGDIELDDSEYDYLVSAKEFLNENGLDDIEKIKSGILMQGDYTRKTQALADERKAFEANSKQSLEETTKLLQIAQAMVYGNAPKHSTQELMALKESDPYAYEQALEAKVLYDQKRSEINAIATKAVEQNKQLQQEKSQELATQQAEVLIQLEPGFADQNTATQKVAMMTEYYESIGGNPELLNSITDAVTLKVLHDAAMASNTQKQVVESKKPKQKKTSKTVIRKGTSSSRAEKQAAAAKAKRAKSINRDGSIDRNAAVDLILDSFNR